MGKRASAPRRPRAVLTVDEAVELARGAFCRAHLDTLQAQRFDADGRARVAAALGHLSDLWLAKDSLRYRVGGRLPAAVPA